MRGRSRHPQGETDHSGHLTQAAHSGAKVLGLATPGAPLVIALKQFQEFGLDETMQPAASLSDVMQPAAFLSDVTDLRGVGSPATQGLLYVAAFYRDQNDETRAFAERFRKMHHAMPTMFQASIYNSVTHYLKAIEAAGADEAGAVMAKMRTTPIDDFMMKNGRIREDGRVIRDLYLLQVKTPSESRGEWDLAKVIATIPGEQAFRPLTESECPLVRR